MVQDHLSGGDLVDDLRGRYHPEVISGYIEMAYNDLVWQITEAALNPKKGTVDFSHLDAFTQMYRNITVDDDADRSLKYSVLPFAPVKLPEGLGIRLIAPEDDPANPFSHVDSNSQAVFGTLEVGSVDTVPTYHIEKVSGNEYRAYYDSNIGSIAEVSMLLVLPYAQIDDFDQLPMPGGKEMAIFDAVVERMSGKAREDIINDNVVNQ